jgi:hypothetical protein
VETGEKDMTEERIPIAEARKRLGVSPTRMAELLDSGELAWEQSKLDKRVKLVKMSDLEALAHKYGRTLDAPKNEAA